MPVLKDWYLSLSSDHILRAQGADPQVLRDRRPALVEIAEWALKEGLPLLEPRVLFRHIAVKSIRHERLELEAAGNSTSPPVLSGRLVAQHLGPAEWVTVLLCTIGSTLEDIVSEVMQTDPLQGWALDGLGSAAVEALALEACHHFEGWAAQQGLQSSLPLSPGMIGWPVEAGQPEIFALIDPGEIGVSLTASQQMLPRKTLSMVLGVGAHVSQGGRTCDYCSLNQTCRYQNHYAPVDTGL